MKFLPPESVFQIGKNRGYLTDSKKSLSIKRQWTFEEALSPLNRAAPADLKAPADRAIVLYWSRDF